MNPYAIGKIKDFSKTYFYIYRKEDGSICLLPTKYLKYKINANRSPNTVRRISYSLIFFMYFLSEHKMQFEDVYLLQFSKQQEFFQDFLYWLKAGRHIQQLLGSLPQNKTCNAYLKNVFGFYHFMEMEYDQFKQLKVVTETSISYINSVGLQKSKKVNIFHGYLENEINHGKSIEKSKIIALLENCTNCKNQLLLLLLAETGFRIGELLGIHLVEDIDYEKHSLRVYFRSDNENDARAKYAEYRWAKISEETFSILLLYCSTYRELLKNSSYLFVNLAGPSKGSAMNVNAVYAIMRNLEKKTAIKVTPHMLRHYFANERRKAGWDLLLISQALGHRNLQTTINYLNIENKELVDASEEFYKRTASLYRADQLL